MKRTIFKTISSLEYHNTVSSGRQLIRKEYVAYKKAGNNAYFGNGFEAGIKFALNKGQTLPIHDVSDSLQADIRNKLSPLSNLIAMIEGDASIEWIKNQIPQAKISIDYLSNYR